MLIKAPHHVNRSKTDSTIGILRSQVNICLFIIGILLSHKISSNENYRLSSWNIKSNYWSCSSKMGM